MAATGWVVKKFSGNYVYLKNFFGLRMAKLQRFDHRLDFIRLDRFLKDNRVVFTVLEPGQGLRTDDFPTHRFRLSRSPYLPTKTLIIDLKQSRADFWRGLSTNLRRILNQPAKTRIVKPDADTFYLGWKKNARVWILSQDYFKKLLESFGNKAELWASEFRGELASGCIILRTGKAAYYYQAWTSPQGRKLNAHHHLIWEILNDLKGRGVIRFDWDGIDDPRFRRDSWQGFSEFKRKFGGKEVAYPGSWQRWF